MKSFLKKVFFLSFGIFLLSSCTQKNEPEDISLLINTNKSHPVKVAFQAKNNETLLLTEKNNTLQLIFIDEHKNAGTITLSLKGLPETLSFQGTTATFSNYTDTTVDISVVRADSTQETFLASSLLPPSFSFLPSAYASSAEYSSMAGTALNTVSCGVGLGTILFSGGASSPLAYLGCGMLMTRITTVEIDFPECTGDIIDCSLETLKDTFTYAINSHGPDFLKQGLFLEGSVKNSITKTPIETGVMISKLVHGNWKSDGSYSLHIQEPGAYQFKISALGFTPAEFQILVSNTKFHIFIPQNNISLEQEISSKDILKIPLDFFLDPESYIRGEVLDITEGDSLKDATVKLLFGETVAHETTTDTNGMFSLFPPLHEEGQQITILVSKKGYKTIKTPLFLSYEVEKNNDEYDIPEFTGIIKTEESQDIWEFTFSLPQKEDRKCSKEVYETYKNPKAHIEDGKIQGIYAVEGCEKEGCVVWPLSGTIEHGKVNAIYNISTFMFGSEKHIVLGTIDENSGKGTWEKPIPEGVSRGERHHYEGCNGTWTVRKL